MQAQSRITVATTEGNKIVSEKTVARCVLRVMKTIPVKEEEGRPKAGKGRSRKTIHGNGLKGEDEGEMQKLESRK